MHNTDWAAALAAPDRDSYVAERVAAAGGTAEHYEHIWRISHMTMREVWQHTGLTQRAFAARLCVPLRTVEAWCEGSNAPPAWARLLILRTCTDLVPED